VLGRAPSGAPLPAPPQVRFGDLFIAVQTEHLFSDGKTFADAVPNAPPRAILAAYHAQHPTNAAALRRFVEVHFTLPPVAVAPAPAPASGSAPASLVAHIDGLWQQLIRNTPTAPAGSSLLPLPEPYVVPGGRFREVYYWDSYFTMLGLEESGRHDLVLAMVRDFAYLIDAYGHVPNGTRTYYLSRSQPPFLYAMVALLEPANPGKAFARYLPQLEREYAFWMAGGSGLGPGHARRRVVALPDGTVLNRYWDDRDTPRDESYAQDRELADASGRVPAQLYRDLRAAAESGWDFGSRWLADGTTLASIYTTEIVPPDLNSLIFGLESAIAAGCEAQGDQHCAAQFKARAQRRHAAIDRYLWDEAAGAYLDYRWTRRARLPHVSAATLYPLFVGVASSAQAAAVARTTRAQLLKAGGLVTTTLTTAQQWDAPNGWAPLQWVGVSGLNRYDHNRLAEAVACRWLQSVRRVYAQSGKLVEKYDVVDSERMGGGGEYPLQDGFGWTNGVTRKLMALYPADAVAAHCPALEPVTP
jgi:alpha,alpha-trehalase